VYPQIYLGHIPAKPAERRALRALALDLRARVQAVRAPEPTTLLLRFAAGEGPAADIDLLLLRPQAAIVGALRTYRGPIVAGPGGPWSYCDTGEPIRELRGRTPTQHVKAQRDAVRERLDDTAGQLLGLAPQAQPFERMVGALICVPATHPESRITLEVSEHRQQIKVLGLDELAQLATMLQIGAHLSDEAMQAIVSDLFAGRLWHDGQRFLFDLAPQRFQLRVLADGARGDKVLPLIEGENVIGRRRAPQKYEHRLTLSGDELISADHALLICGDDDRITLRDTSKNGTWITTPGAKEERVRQELAIVPGTLLRMGMTRARLERVGG
jgi:FHA domain